MAKEVILRIDEAREYRALLQWEPDLRKTLKLWVLGLASLAHTIARQRTQTPGFTTCKLAIEAARVGLIHFGSRERK
jgi:hypothetical protein